MGELLDRLITALWQTIVFCGPMWFVFVAIMTAVCVYFMYLSFRDESVTSREAARSGEALGTARPVTDSPCLPGIFDQEQQPAWMPGAVECQIEYRKFHRGHRKNRAAARRSVA